MTSGFDIGAVAVRKEGEKKERKKERWVSSFLHRSFVFLCFDSTQLGDIGAEADSAFQGRRV